MKGSKLMKNSLMLPLAVAGQLLIGAGAEAQGSGKNVTVFRMGGPQLGVRLEEVDRDVVSRLKLKEEKGALVTEVIPGSAAEKAGLQKDDVILKFQGESVLTAAQLARLVRDVPSGRKVDLDVIRAGAPLKVSATLERGEWTPDGVTVPDMPEFADKMGRMGELHWKTPDGGAGGPAFSFKLDDDGPGRMSFTRSGRARLGISYTEIDGQLADFFKAPADHAILINSVAADSAAAKAGVKAGDLLVKLGGASIEETGDLREAVGELEPGKPTSVTVLREGKNVELSLTLPEPSRPKTAAPRSRGSVY
jgi:C-terminal processing protease CtpA/Prc